MKILQFIYTLEAGGAERFAVDLSNELAKSNILSLYVLRNDNDNKCNGFYKSQISKDVVYVNLNIPPGFKPGLIWRFYKIIKTEKPDVVHCHLNLVNYFFLLSILYYGKVRFVYTLHSSASTEVESSFERRIRRFFFKWGFFQPVAISDETLVSYKDFYKLKDIPVIYNGRSAPEKTSQFDSVSEEIRSLKPTVSTLVFCHMARYNLYKNQKMLISAFNYLISSGYDVILLIIGAGFDKAKHLLDMADKRIHFLGLKSNIGDYLNSCDGFCLSSFNEGMPISLIEALSCGCVPVCTPVGGIKNLIINRELGFISKSISEEDYIDALKDFITNRHLVRKEDLVNFYRNNFEIGKCAQNYIDLYRNKR